jgi:hypothetical protein
MYNEKFVRSVYPDAKLQRYFIFGKWYAYVHSYSCGYMTDLHIGWVHPAPPKNCEEAWEHAVRYINREMLRKLES